jgi:hypothetical protein
VDPYWYRAQFVIAATAANAALKEDPASSSTAQRSRGAWGHARKQAGCLLIGAERALMARVRGELRTFLEELEASALILLAGTFIGSDGKNIPISGDLTDERYHALDMTERGEVSTDYLIKMATSLPMSPRAHYNLACYYSSKAAWLAGQPGGDRDERTQQIGAYYSRSIEELELALSALDAGMKRTADNDVSLGGVKKYCGTKGKFSRLVGARPQ